MSCQIKMDCILLLSHVILTTESGQPVDNHTLSARSSRYNKKLEK
jgi:hypothetical protein